MRDPRTMATASPDQTATETSSSVSPPVPSSGPSPGPSSDPGPALTAFEDARRDRWSFLLVLGVAVGVILPFLGAVGFFDPWETHYAEVARQMVVRDDYLYPFWKDAHFFSKPILLFWMTAPGYALLGADGPGPMPVGVELVGRLPSALLGILTIAMVFIVARRFWSRRAATFSALVLATSPMWAFMSRQAITDLPYVALASIGLLALAPTLFDDDDARARAAATPLPRWLVALAFVTIAPQAWEIARTGAFLNDVDVVVSERFLRVVLGVAGVAVVGAGAFWLRRRGRDPWLHGAALALGLSVLAKGPVGLGIVGVVLVLVLLLLRGVDGVLQTILHPALLSASLLFIGVAAPWPVVMMAYDGLDDQRKTWFERFIRYDLLGRVSAGVHGDRGGLEYYVRYLGFGMLPWIGVVPLAVFDALQKVRTGVGTKWSRRDRLLALNVVWAIFVFVFFAATTTKFHHYILPFLVPAALLTGAFFDGLLSEGRRSQVMVGLIALATTVVVARELSQAPWEWIDLFSYHYKSYKPEYYFPVDTLNQVTIAGGTALSAWRVGTPLLGLLPIGLAALMALVLVVPPIRRRLASWAPGTLLSTMDIVDVKESAGGRPLAVWFVGAAMASVLGVQVYWAQASQHWSQRWLSGTYESLRKADEPIIAYQMDWKGETFYNKNHEIQIKKNNDDFRAAIARPGRTFVLVQQDRLDNLKKAVGNGADARVVVVDRSNAKWLLVTVD